MSGRKTIAGHSRGGLKGINSEMICDEKAGLLVEEPQPAVRRRTPRRGLNDQTQKRLGLHLRAMYDSIVQQPVPDRFTDLIARLDETEAGTEKA